MPLIPKPDPMALQPQSWWRDNKGKVGAGAVATVATVVTLAIATSCPSWPVFLQPLCPVASTVVTEVTRPPPAKVWAHEPVCVGACALEGPTFGMAEVDGGYCWCPGR